MTNSVSRASERLRRVATIRSLRLGELTLTYLPDGVVGLDPLGWLPDSTEQTWAEHPEYLDDSGQLVASIGALLVEHGERALLIDAGVGPLELPAEPGRPFGAMTGGALLDSLAKHGRPLEEIETVALTHLHLDHIGWAWSAAPGGERPALAGADYRLAESEWARLDLAEAAGASPETLAALAPRVHTATDGEEVFPGVRLLLTAGHTAGHASYVISAGGRRVVVFGDALHSPIQVEHPGWSAAPDIDRAQSADSRRRLVAELAEPGTIGFGGHFADVPFGEIGAGGAWVPISD
ncbi:MAG TPA: MBL fold metallo-hydrolase [Pseudonocardia sp.]|jgi:glyoxylase-like metal-dependent hydrolase (beta-lactamase superfamily II)|nr:MBL fold metallo-hydrolase [Pseudonocardia sp.]